MKRTELLLLLCILAIAAGMRLYALDRVPPGLHPDEASYGIEAQQHLSSGAHVGIFARLQALSIRTFGNTVFALRFVSALAGILTVLGVYLLCRRIFDSWELAAMAAVMMATGFWHVNFSRIGIPAIMAPLLATWGFYYLYKGIETHRLWHWGLAGVLFGLGFHLYGAFRVMPLAIVLVLIAYWWGLWRTFSHGKYEHERHQMLGGAATLVALIVLVALPVFGSFSIHIGDFSGSELLRNKILTLGMLFVRGDTNWMHNTAGDPALFWPVAAFAAAGLVHTIWRLIQSLRTKGAPGIVQTLLLAWLLVGLAPGILPSDGVPNAMRTLTAAPAAYIMAAVGLHWLHVWMRKWYSERDAHEVALPWVGHAGSYGRPMHMGQSALVMGLATISLLVAFGIADAHRYFVSWADDPRVADAFSAQYIPIAMRITTLPPATLKYVIVSRGDQSAQPVRYLTDTGTAAQQQLRQVTYLTSEELRQTRIPSGAVVIPLDP